MNDYTEIIKSVQALTNDCLPPLDISEILYNHKCYYLLSKKIQSNKYTEKAQMANNIQLIQTVQRYKTCAAFFCFLNENNIKYAVIKGAVLSNAAYGTICVRQSCDIDILIESKNLDIIKSFMQKNNFIQGRIVGNNIFPLSREEIMFQTLMTHQTAPYIKKTSNVFCPFVNVDINTDIVWGESQLHPNISNVLSQTTDVKICDQRLKKLNAELEFISLCLHHYKDMNSIYLLTVGGIRLCLFCDIYFYLKNNFIDKQLLKEFSKLLKVDKYIHYCLYYTNLVFNDEIINDYINLFAYAEDAEIINSFGLDNDERKSWQIGFYERLFHENIGNYIYKFLTPKDIEKINMNIKYM
jgi:hypothetical protein